MTTKNLKKNYIHMKKVIITIAGGLLCSISAFSQNEIDALRYSTINYGGTARFAAMGGAFGALGADLSNLSVNPAGIALFSKTEFSFTPGIFNSSTNSTYNGFSSGDSKSSFNIGNVGIVGSNNNTVAEGASGWVNTNFAIGYNNMGNFHNRLSIYGTNAGSSFLDVLKGSADGNMSEDLDGFSDKLAFRTYMLDTMPGDPYTYYTPLIPGAEIGQLKSVESRGNMGETYITFGGNYSNKLYLGATFGIDNVRYSEDADYNESDSQDTINGFDEYTYSSSLSTRGIGFNFKFGMIYRVNDWVRFGGAIHSPTYFSLSDAYSNRMNSRFDNGQTYSASSPEGNYDYYLSTPLRATGSLAFVIAKKGLLSADYEFVDYSSAVLSSSPNTFFDANNSIRNKYTSTANLRVGTEWRLDPFSIRAGYAMYGNPYKANTGNNSSKNIISAGFGIREKEYFLDFAYTYSISDEKYYMYDPSLVNAAATTTKQSGFLMTLGFRY